MEGKLMSRILVPFFLFTALILMLAACGSAASTSASAPTVGTTPTTGVPVTTPSIPPDKSTPSPVTGGSKPIAPLKGIRMLDAHNGWALTAQAILKTVDGGVHWNDVTPANAELNAFARGDFLNIQDAWIAIPPPQQIEGPGIIVLHTTDGGTSWQHEKINDPVVATIDVPHFMNAQQGWLEASSSPGAGHAGSDIWHTTDGGQTWVKIASNAGGSGLTLGYVTGISFQDAQTGIATGNLGAGGENSLPSVSITHDGGKTWHTDSLPHLLGGYTVTMNTSEPPVFFGNTVVMPVNVTTDSGNLLVLYRSNTSGRIWYQTSVVHIQSENTYVLDPSHAWTTDTQSGQLYNTTNGGTIWFPISTIAYNLQALSFADASIGWGITRETLLHTIDGGKTWQQIDYTIQ